MVAVALLTQPYTCVVLLTELTVDTIFAALLGPYDTLVAVIVPLIAVPEIQLKGRIDPVSVPICATKNTAYGCTVVVCEVVICAVVENTNVGRPLMLSVPTAIASAPVETVVDPVPAPLFTIDATEVPLVVYDVRSAASIHTQGLISVGNATGILLHVYGTIAAVVTSGLVPIALVAVTLNVYEVLLVRPDIIMGETELVPVNPPDNAVAV